jgi:hypothetical protein
LLPETTRQFRAMLARRMTPHWAGAPAAARSAAS